MKQYRHYYPPTVFNRPGVKKLTVTATLTWSKVFKNLARNIPGNHEPRKSSSAMACVNGMLVQMLLLHLQKLLVHSTSHSLLELAEQPATPFINIINGVAR